MRPDSPALLAAVRTALDRPTDALVGKVYFDALEDCGIEEVLASLNAAAKNCERFPSPAELRGNIRAARVHTARLKSTREALSEEPGEPIALPAGHGPAGQWPPPSRWSGSSWPMRPMRPRRPVAHQPRSGNGGRRRDVGPEHGPAPAPAGWRLG